MSLLVVRRSGLSSLKPDGAKPLGASSGVPSHWMRESGPRAASAEWEGRGSSTHVSLTSWRIPPCPYHFPPPTAFQLQLDPASARSSDHFRYCSALGCSAGTGGGCHSLKNRGDFLSYNCSRMALHCSHNGSRIGPLQLALYLYSYNGSRFGPS